MSLMPISHQSKILRAMMQPECYPHPVQAIERRETHISTVFLTGPFVYKIKKPVDLGFLDFSTLDKRRTCCRQEVTLNRRLSEGVYVDVVPITLHDGRYKVDASGPAVEFAVKMRQLADADAMHQRLTDASLTQGQMEALMRRLVDFYENATADCAMAATAVPAWEENLQRMDGFAGIWIDRRQYAFVRTAMRTFAGNRQSVFERRRTNQKIRDGHGDLRSDHIYFTEDGIQVIDCIEFNSELRCVDIISDLAFLAMDLEAQGFWPTAASLIQLYIHATGDLGALPLLDFYRCYRAMVRCKVSCYRLAEGGQAYPAWNDFRRSAARYLDLARQYAELFCRPTLWVVCGPPASGKSTIAAALAALYEIAVIRSDVLRKKLFGGSADPLMRNTLDQGIYSPSATETTYERMNRLADEALKTGNSMVVDATFSRMAHRLQILRMAKNRQALPVFVECLADEAILAERLRKRETAPSVSDARLLHLEAFKSRFEPLKAMTGAVHIRIDTADPLPHCLRQILLTTVQPAAAPVAPNQRAQQGGYHVSSNSGGH